MDVFEVNCKGVTRKYLITVDHFSDFYELDILKDLSAKETINTCKKNFARFGVPCKVITDGATNFINQDFKNFSNDWKFSHITSSPHYPKSNGKAEVTVKIAKNLILKCFDSNEDIWYALLHQRNVPQTYSDASPVQKFLARKTRTSIPQTLEQHKHQVLKDIPESIKLRKTRSKQYHDRKSRQLSVLENGQNVYVKLFPEKEAIWYPGKIKERATERSYIIEVDGRLYRRNRTYIKPFFIKDTSSCTNKYNERESNENERYKAGFQYSYEYPSITPEANQNLQTLAPDVGEDNSNLSLSLPTRPKRNVGPPKWLSDYSS
ncbi:unnamed protein product [Euphydryas editha]|uniref:Integrase catalytic domain-containing protein n=1 Tax=Euphydryas editha TaxID=104508 RepID=A0AAU9VBX9_EUPED|nr:unnamed protein product [Euphydryas editha]